MDEYRQDIVAKMNVFWSIYVNIEREIINLADMIYFSDKQLSVYSVRISDLLMRCNVELESLIRELYKDEFENVLANPGDMLIALNNNWFLDKKKITIIATNMHFTEKYASFCPFNYKHKDENDYYQAYNAIKHDRSNNFENYATIHYLLRALGALYILNIYYRKVEVSNIISNFDIDTKFGSKIFSFISIILRPKYPERIQILSTAIQLEAVYVIKPVSGYDEYYDEFQRAFEKQCQLLVKSGYNYEKDDEGNDKEIPFGDVYNIVRYLDNTSALIRKLAELEALAQVRYHEIKYIATLNTKHEIKYLEN